MKQAVVTVRRLTVTCKSSALPVILPVPSAKTVETLATSVSAQYAQLISLSELSSLSSALQAASRASTSLWQARSAAAAFPRAQLASEHRPSALSAMRQLRHHYSSRKIRPIQFAWQHRVLTVLPTLAVSASLVFLLAHFVKVALHFVWLAMALVTPRLFKMESVMLAAQQDRQMTEMPTASRARQAVTNATTRILQSA